jgi:Calcineurin-like phosphoesterase
MTALLAADIHNTSNPRDAYRNGLLSWMAQMVQKYHVDTVLILGDLTDAKDRHSAALVNKFVDDLAALAVDCAVYILRGNHDYINLLVPFFSFVRHIKNVHFVNDVLEQELRFGDAKSACLFLPNTTDPIKDWKRFAGKLNKYRYVFCHQTFRGALRENGTQSEEGISTDFFKGFAGKVYSGDIHVPQKIGPVVYVGAPYRIDFGDAYQPRVLLLDNDGKQTSLHYPCPNKYLIDIAADGSVTDSLDNSVPAKGDLVKVRCTLKRADLPTWPKLKDHINAMAKDGGWLLFGPELRTVAEDEKTSAVENPRTVDPEQLVRDYAAEQKADKMLTEIGVQILADVV